MIAWLCVFGLVLASFAFASLIVWVIDRVPPWMGFVIMYSPVWAFILWVGHAMFEMLLKSKGYG